MSVSWQDQQEDRKPPCFIAGVYSMYCPYFFTSNIVIKLLSKSGSFVSSHSSHPRFGHAHYNDVTVTSGQQRDESCFVCCVWLNNMTKLTLCEQLFDENRNQVGKTQQRRAWNLLKIHETVQSVTFVRNLDSMFESAVLWTKWPTYAHIMTDTHSRGILLAKTFIKFHLLWDLKPS